MGRTRDETKVDPNNPKTLRPQASAKVDAARALVLHEEKGLTYKEIAALYGVHENAVRNAILPLKKLFGLVGNGKSSTEYRKIESKVLDVIRTVVASKMLDEDKLEKASLRDLAVVFKEIFQAHRLIEEKSTQNVSLRSSLVMAAHEAPIYENDLSSNLSSDLPPKPDAAEPEDSPAGPGDVPPAL